MFTLTRLLELQANAPVYIPKRFCAVGVAVYMWAWLKSPL